VITLKSHAHGRKPETTIEGECKGLRNREAREYVHLRKQGWGTLCVMCAAYTGPLLPWMDNIDHWQDHPMRCR